jgi:hypothetical protein
VHSVLRRAVRPPGNPSRFIVRRRGDRQLEIASTAFARPSGFGRTAFPYQNRLLVGRVERIKPSDLEAIPARFRPVFGRYVAEIGPDEIFRVDAVTLPLSQDGRSVDRMIELEDWRMAPGVRRGQIDPAAWRFEMLNWPAS